MRFLCGVFVAGLAICSPIYAGSLGNGLGASTCADYAKFYRQDPKTADLGYMSWGQGFMTGWNMARLKAGKPTVNIGGWSADDQQRYLRRYCDEHPLVDYVEAVLNFYNVLAKEQNIDL